MTARPIAQVSVRRACRVLPLDRSTCHYRPQRTERADLKILPILIDDGISFFGKLDNDVALHLADVKAYKSAMVALHYEVRAPRADPRSC